MERQKSFDIRAGIDEGDVTFDHVTRRLAEAHDRRGLVGVAASVFLLILLQIDASARSRQRRHRRSDEKGSLGRKRGKGGGGGQKKKKKKGRKIVGCRNGCPANHLCNQGVCVPACVPGQTPCPGAPGGCCLAGEICASGSCVVPCSDGRPPCAGRCCATHETCRELVCTTSMLGVNLIENGDAEAGNDSATCESPVEIPAWTVTDGMSTVCRYGNTTGGWPRPDSPGPVNRGVKFFTGGAASVSRMTQTIDVTPLTGEIDLNQIQYHLSGFLGGFSSQNDSAMLEAVFKTGAVEVGRVSIGPVTAADRSSTTGLLSRGAMGTLPAGTRSIEVILSQTRASGTSNDGYADNLSLILS